MIKPKIDFQTHICPDCFDDHQKGNKGRCIKSLKEDVEYKDQEIQKLKKAVEILRASNAFYAASRNWVTSGYSQDYATNWKDKIISTDRYQKSKAFVRGGKRARQAEAKVKEILGE